MFILLSCFISFIFLIVNSFSVGVFVVISTVTPLFLGFLFPFGCSLSIHSTLIHFFIKRIEASWFYFAFTCLQSLYRNVEWIYDDQSLSKPTIDSSLRTNKDLTETSQLISCSTQQTNGWELVWNSLELVLFLWLVCHLWKRKHWTGTSWFVYHVCIATDRSAQLACKNVNGNKQWNGFCWKESHSTLTLTKNLLLKSKNNTPPSSWPSKGTIHF